ncbi:MAG TPA: hypothetical protein VGE41_07455, partial [Verrucomicrobiae bacterium]
MSALLLGSWFGPVCSFAQDAAAIAEKQEAEDRYKRMNARLEDLETSMERQRQTFTRLNDEIRTLRDEVGKLSSATKEVATQEDIRTLAKAIEKVDQNRLAGDKKIASDTADMLSEFKHYLDKMRPPSIPSHDPVNGTVNSGGTAGPTGGNPKSNTGGTQIEKPTPPARESGYEYKIQPNDTLSRIVT